MTDPAQIEALIERLKSPNRYDQIYADRLCAEAASALAALRDENAALRKERDGLLAFKRSVDEALNSGDGSYKP